MKSKINRRTLLKSTAAGITGTAVMSGTASAVELFNSYYADSTIYLHDTYDSSSTYGTREQYTGMRTIDGPVTNDGYTWWKVEINGDYDNYQKDKAWVAQKDMAKSHFAYGSDCYFTSTHCEGRGHEGVDIACNGEHRYVFAGQGGTCSVSTGYNGGYGNLIEIHHDNDYSTLYAHLEDIYVSDGQTVSKFDKIGLTGNTGCDCGIHLHQELRRYGDALEWPHRVYDKNGNRIEMWRQTGIPQVWSSLSC